jgi:5'-nucleotidase
LAKSCGFPWLLGNIKYSLTGKNLGEGLDYHIIHRGGFKIGFLGLAGPDFVGRMISDYHQKLKYKNLAEYAKTVCKRLQELSCDLIVALTHARRPADTDLAQKVPEIDLILGGHDHHSLF